MKTVEEVANETVLEIVRTSLETGIPFTIDDLKITRLVATIAVTLDRKDRAK